MGVKLGNNFLQRSYQHTPDFLENYKIQYYVVRKDRTTSLVTIQQLFFTEWAAEAGSAVVNQDFMATI